MRERDVGLALVAELERELAEARDSLVGQIRDLEAEVEKLRANVDWFRATRTVVDNKLKEAEAKLAEVEKERDKWRRDYEDEVNDPYRDAFMQDIQRARELVEELITPPVTRSPWPAGAQEDLQTIARLLSGKAE